MCIACVRAGCVWAWAWAWARKQSHALVTLAMQLRSRKSSNGACCYLPLPPSSTPTGDGCELSFDAMPMPMPSPVQSSPARPSSAACATFTFPFPSLPLLTLPSCPSSGRTACVSMPSSPALARVTCLVLRRASWLRLSACVRNAGVEAACRRAGCTPAAPESGWCVAVRQIHLPTLLRCAADPSSKVWTGICVTGLLGAWPVFRLSSLKAKPFWRCVLVGA